MNVNKLHLNNNIQNESIEYKYNARNWLTEAIATNFSFKLNYNEIAGGVTPQYNGNISRQQWGEGATLNNSYIYLYDKMNRILNGKSNIGYDETIGEGNYDKVGNIKKIVRTGIIDNINLNYNGNRLVNVQGIINNTNINFKINYNANGSVVNDGKNNIAYNEINLPINIGSSGKYYFYTYNAKGEKLRRFANIIESRYYNDGVEYVNDTLKKIDIINIEDGLIKIKGNNINYLYFLKDHLGNTRVVLNANNGVNKMVQKINYYPFGKAHTKVADTINRYLYNGKEMQDSSGFYDYGARYYNPNIGRFLTIDRYAEKYYMLTPYQYAANNPIKYIDVNGDSLNIAEQYREQMNQILKNIFNENVANFSYSSTGMLIFNGETSNFSNDQKKIFKEFNKVLNDEQITNVIFEEKTEITLKNGGKQNVKAADGGGAITILAAENNLKNNTILIDPNISKNLSIYAVTSAYFISPIDPSNGARFKQINISTNLTDAFFYEIGHILYQGNTQDKVIDFNNKLRKAIDLPIRPYDENHNRKVKNRNY